MTPIWKVSISAATLGIALTAAHRWQVAIDLEPLTLSRHKRRTAPYRGEQERHAWFQRNRAFAALWLARHQRDLSADLLPYLRDPAESLRTRAVRALGRLEQPAAEAPLAALLQRVQAGSVPAEERVPELTLRLALARVRSRRLRSAARVQALAQAARLSADQLGQLSAMVNDPVGRSTSAGSPGDEIIREVVDLLYTLGERGEDVRPLSAGLTLSPAQQVKLRAASLSTDEEVRAILDYATHLSTVGGDDEELTEDHLLALGPQARESIIRRLTELRSHRDQFGQGGTRVGTLFRAAALSGDPRALPLLRAYEHDALAALRASGYSNLNDPGISEQLARTPDFAVYALAQQSRQKIEQDLIFPVYPPL